MKNQIIFSLVVVIFLVILSVRPTLPHPHVFIYNSINVLFDEKGLAGFRVKWVFDEMFSNMIINDFDKNRNRRFESQEIEHIKNGAFSNLKNFDYFTHIKIAEKIFKVKFVKDFSADIKDNALVYWFFIPCHIRATSSFNEIKISIYDMSFYCSVFLTKDPVGFENDSSYEHHHKIGRNKKEAYYYEQVNPEEITLRFRLKHG